MKARGLTLIELMVTVAMMGVAVGTAGAAVLWQRQQAVDATHLERARALLDAEAGRVLRGEPEDAAAVARRLAALPGGSIHRSASEGLWRLEVGWRSSRGAERRTLSLVQGGTR